MGIRTTDTNTAINKTRRQSSRSCLRHLRLQEASMQENSADNGRPLFALVMERE
jgi:hypothetical protein